jgi:hypothetical protein
MTETNSTPASDAASALVTRLEAEAQFVDEGSFTLDPQKAREKLAAYQLAEPERYVLFLVEAAHLLPNCTNVAFTIDSVSTQVVFDGVELRGDELEGCFDALFVDVDGHDPESARRIRARQRLALAINTALGLPDARVEMHSTIAGEASVRVAFDAGRRVQTNTLPGASSTSSLVVELHHVANSELQQTALRDDTRYATVPIQLDGVRIGAGRAELCAVIEMRDAEDRVVGQVGWCAAQARLGLGSVMLMANGVTIEMIDHHPGVTTGMVALADASDLARDISQSKLQHDEAFAQRLEAVKLSCRALSRPTPTLAPSLGREEVTRWSMIFALLAVFALAGAVFVWRRFGWLAMGGLILVLALGLTYRGISLIQRAHRHRRLQTDGQAGLGHVAGSSLGGLTFTSLRKVWLDMSIERSGQEPYNASLQTHTDMSTESMFEPGRRFYVRIDPNDRRQVVFDHGE